MDSITAIKRGLDKLSKPELEHVKSYISMRLGSGLSGPKSSARSSISADTMLDALVEVARGRGIDTASAGSLRRGVRFKTFKTKVEDEGLADFIRTAVKRNRVKAHGMVHFSLELLVEDLRRWNVSMNSVTMMNHINRIPAVLDKAFPGYAECGLLHLVIREKEEEDVREEPSDEAVPRRKGTAARKRHVLHHSGRRARRG